MLPISNSNGSSSISARLPVTVCGLALRVRGSRGPPARRVDGHCDHLLQRGFKRGDILVGHGFGDGDDQTVLEARPRPDRAAQAKRRRARRFSTIAWTAGRASTGSFSVNSLKKLSLTKLDARDRRQPVRRLARARVVQGCELPQALLAKQGQVDGERERAQHRAGADVRGRLLAADMLLAGRKRQDEAALAFGVDSFAGEPARHLADMLLAAGEQADIGAAELQPDADRLAFANDDVRAHLARRADQAERDRLGNDGDQQRARSVRRFGDRRQVGDPAEDVGILDDDGAGLAVDARDQPLGVGFGAQLRQRRLERVAGELGHGLGDADIMRVDARRDHGLVPARDAVRHQDRFPHRRRAVVHRRVGDFAAEQARDLRLELEHHLQRALRDLGLVGRVAGQELAALDDVVDARRHMMPVGAAAEEEGHVARDHVLARQGAPCAARPPFPTRASAGRRSGP